MNSGRPASVKVQPREDEKAALRVDWPGGQLAQGLQPPGLGGPNACCSSCPPSLALCQGSRQELRQAARAVGDPGGRREDVLLENQCADKQGTPPTTGHNSQEARLSSQRPEGRVLGLEFHCILRFPQPFS